MAWDVRPQDDFSILGTRRRFPLVPRKSSASQACSLSVKVTIQFYSPTHMDYSRTYNASPTFDYTNIDVLSALFRRLEHCCGELITRKDSTASDGRRGYNDEKSLRYEIKFTISRPRDGPTERIFRSYQSQVLTMDGTRDIILATDRMVGLFLHRHDPGFRWVEGPVREDFSPNPTVSHHRKSGPESLCCIPRSRFLEESQSFEFVAGYCIDIAFSSVCATRRPRAWNKAIKVQSSQRTPTTLHAAGSLLSAMYKGIHQSLDHKRQVYSQTGGSRNPEGAVCIEFRVHNNIGPQFPNLVQSITSDYALFSHPDGFDCSQFMDEMESLALSMRDVTDSSISSTNDLEINILDIQGHDWFVDAPFSFVLDSSVLYSRRTIEALMDRVQTGISHILKPTSASVSLSIYKRGHLVLDKMIPGHTQPFSGISASKSDDEKHDIVSRLTQRINEDIIAVCKDTCSIMDNCEVPNLSVVPLVTPHSTSSRPSSISRPPSETSIHLSDAHHTSFLRPSILKNYQLRTYSYGTLATLDDDDTTPPATPSLLSGDISISRDSAFTTPMSSPFSISPKANAAGTSEVDDTSSFRRLSFQTPSPKSALSHLSLSMPLSKQENLAQAPLLGKKDVRRSVSFSNCPVVDRSIARVLFPRNSSEQPSSAESLDQTSDIFAPESRQQSAYHPQSILELLRPREIPCPPPKPNTSIAAAEHLGNDVDVTISESQEPTIVEEVAEATEDEVPEVTESKAVNDEQLENASLPVTGCGEVENDDDESITYQGGASIVPASESDYDFDSKSRMSSVCEVEFAEKTATESRTFEDFIEESESPIPQEPFESFSTYKPEYDFRFDLGSCGLATVLEESETEDEDEDAGVPVSPVSAFFGSSDIDEFPIKSEAPELIDSTEETVIAELESLAGLPNAVQPLTTTDMALEPLCDSVVPLNAEVDVESDSPVEVFEVLYGPTEADNSETVTLEFSVAAEPVSHDDLAYVSDDLSPPSSFPFVDEAQDSEDYDLDVEAKSNVEMADDVVAMVPLPEFHDTSIESIISPNDLAKVGSVSVSQHHIITDPFECPVISYETEMPPVLFYISSVVQVVDISPSATKASKTVAVSQYDAAKVQEVDSAETFDNVSIHDVETISESNFAESFDDPDSVEHTVVMEIKPSTEHCDDALEDFQTSNTETIDALEDAAKVIDQQALVTPETRLPTQSLAAPGNDEIATACLITPEPLTSEEFLLNEVHDSDHSVPMLDDLYADTVVATCSKDSEVPSYEATRPISDFSDDINLVESNCLDLDKHVIPLDVGASEPLLSGSDGHLEEAIDASRVPLPVVDDSDLDECDVDASQVPLPQSDDDLLEAIVEEQVDPSTIALPGLVAIDSKETLVYPAQIRLPESDDNELEEVVIKIEVDPCFIALPVSDDEDLVDIINIDPCQISLPESDDDDLVESEVDPCEVPLPESNDEDLYEAEIDPTLICLPGSDDEDLSEIDIIPSMVPLPESNDRDLCEIQANPCEVSLPESDNRGLDEAEVDPALISLPESDDKDLMEFDVDPSAVFLPESEDEDLHEVEVDPALVCLPGSNDEDLFEVEIDPSAVPLPESDDEELDEVHVNPCDVPLPDFDDDDLSEVYVNPCDVSLPESDDSDLKEIGIEPSDVPLPESNDDGLEDMKVDPCEVSLHKSNEEELVDFTVAPCKIFLLEIDPAEVPLPYSDDNDLAEIVIDATQISLPESDDTDLEIDPCEVALPESNDEDLEETVDASEVPLPESDDTDLEVDPSDIALPESDDKDLEEIIDASEVPLPESDDTDLEIDPCEVALPESNDEDLEETVDASQIPLPEFDDAELMEQLSEATVESPAQQPEIEKTQTPISNSAIDWQLVKFEPPAVFAVESAPSEREESEPEMDFVPEETTFTSSSPAENISVIEQSLSALENAISIAEGLEFFSSSFGNFGDDNDDEDDDMDMASILMMSRGLGDFSNVVPLQESPSLFARQAIDVKGASDCAIIDDSASEADSEASSTALILRPKASYSALSEARSRSASPERINSFSLRRQPSSSLFSIPHSLTMPLMDSRPSSPSSVMMASLHTRPFSIATAGTLGLHGEHAVGASLRNMFMGAAAQMPMQRRSSMPWHTPSREVSPVRSMSHYVPSPSPSPRPATPVRLLEAPRENQKVEVVKRRAVGQQQQQRQQHKSGKEDGHKTLIAKSDGYAPIQVVASPLAIQKFSRRPAFGAPPSSSPSSSPAVSTPPPAVGSLFASGPGLGLSSSRLRSLSTSHHSGSLGLGTAAATRPHLYFRSGLLAHLKPPPPAPSE